MAYEGEGADAPNYKYKYDVFFSFRGSDTRYNFIDSVYRGLRQMGLVIFYDDKVLYSEDESKLSVLKAIEESRTSIVFLSSNYASSSWCLDELAKIIECMRSKNHRVYPVYFGVDPSDVRHQKGSYGYAMAKHEERFHQERVQGWRSALHTLSSLSGWHFQRDKEQYEQEIAQMIAEFFSSMVPSFDVFLSSSWGHTCHSFTSFLYNILLKEGFQIVVHKSRLDYLSIKGSRFSIIVFSEDYAKCADRLDSLVEILDCMKSRNHRVFPIFYKVQPSEVRYQLSHYKDAMAIHEEMFGKEEVLEWKLALSEAANLKGWHFQSGYEYKTIQGIMEMVNKFMPRYDVFLSFRGRDTRDTFTGYLYYALCKKGLRTFMDDEALQGGDQISNTLLNAIQKSTVSIIVFSENYAQSSWCLDELAIILKWQKNIERHHIIFPIYYKVEPSDVWFQNNKYGEFMNDHENSLRYDNEKVEEWRSAMSEVPRSEKWHFKTGEDEYEFIENISGTIVEKVVGARKKGG